MEGIPQQPGAEGPPPTEEEIQRALEEQMRNIRVEDVLLQSVASLVSLTARRIAKDDERDLEQASLGIEAVRALVDLLPEEAAGQVRNALSELQMLYARHSGGAPEGEEAGGEQPPADAGAEAPPPPRQQPPQQPGQEPPSRLWTPGST